MAIVRPVVWSEDIPALCGLDTSFTTDRIYRLDRQAFSFTLAEQRVSPPLTKTVCHMADEISSLQKMEHTVVAAVNRMVVGFAAAQHSAWNNRVVLWHLYVLPAYRGYGIGTALMQSVLAYAEAAGAWCVWLEAQNVNYPALQFYIKRGFRICGLDTNLYDPKGPGKDEVAVYLSRELN
ncbi:MAG TPA: GNAT family N-acetyltransferase [Symbiobacteriaceae bacterium]|nr:GNAT family N-acetyltransferase [Symbiobacteriaceae bacterium]